MGDVSGHTSDSHTHALLVMPFRVDSLDKLKDLVPTLDVEFLEGQDFKGDCPIRLMMLTPTTQCVFSDKITSLGFADFYRFAFLFSLEGSHRVIGTWHVP